MYRDIGGEEEGRRRAGRELLGVTELVKTSVLANRAEMFKKAKMGFLHGGNFPRHVH